VNIAIVIFLIEVELVVATIPHNPIVRLCAMTTATAAFYIGFLLIFSSILTSLRRPLPFNMSSTPKGSPWRPALYGIVEDFVAIEMKGQKAYRAQLSKRYEASSMFRRMFLVLSWGWGVGLILVAIATTALVMLLPIENVFAVGWWLPFACAAIMGLITPLFVKWSLRREHDTWRSKVHSGGSSVDE
jgi:hypothetical protein